MAEGLEAQRLAFTTDTFVVKPLFFRGGDIGRLAVAGTVNEDADASAQAVAVAEAEFQRAQSQYEKTQALHEQALTQTHPQEIAIAKADYQAALARYEQVKAGPSSEELAAARAQVRRPGLSPRLYRYAETAPR